jgi:hypothetical protein
MKKAPMKMKKTSSMKMKKAPMKMAKKSAMKKALVGKQKNLPAGLRKAILASPSKMLKPAAMKMMQRPTRTSTVRKMVQGKPTQKSTVKKPRPSGVRITSSSQIRGPKRPTGRLRPVPKRKK